MNAGSAVCAAAEQAGQSTAVQVVLNLHTEGESKGTPALLRIEHLQAQVRHLGYNI